MLAEAIQQQPPTQTQMKSQNQSMYLERFLMEQQDKTSIHESHVFLKVILGKYFIQAFRILKINPENNTIILFKRQNSTTNYNFLLVLNHLQQLHLNAATLRGEQNVINHLKSSIQKMNKRPLQQYTITIALVEQMKKLNFSSLDQYLEFVESCQNEEVFQCLSKSICRQPFQVDSEVFTEIFEKMKVECFVPKLNKENEEILFESKKEIENLKELIFTYIDTFANQQKGSLIYKLIEKSSVSFSIDMLLNTINYILFEQLDGKGLFQIQPSYWTCYESSKRRLDSDRKHIVLTGNGMICILQLILMKEIQSENKMEYLMMLAEFKKFYSKAKIKIYRITNEKWNGELEQIDLEGDQKPPSSSPFIIYKFHSTTVCEHQPKN